MVTVKAIIQQIGIEKVAQHAGIGLSGVRQWYERGVPSKYIVDVAYMAGIEPSMVRTAMCRNQMVTHAKAMDAADGIIRQWGRGTESELKDLIAHEIEQSYAVGKASKKEELK